MRLADAFREDHERTATRLRAAIAEALTPAVRAMLLRKAEENEQLARRNEPRETAAHLDRV